MREGVPWIQHIVEFQPAWGDPFSIVSLAALQNGSATALFRYPFGMHVKAAWAAMRVPADKRHHRFALETSSECLTGEQPVEIFFCQFFQCSGQLVLTHLAAKAPAAAARSARVDEPAPGSHYRASSQPQFGLSGSPA